MPTPKIKICGISTIAALDACIAARADYVGLVFFPPSPRHVGPDMSAQLASRSGKAIKRVGLFVDADDRHLAESIAAGQLDALQLHGDETPARLAELRAWHGLPVWKALPIASAADVARAASYQTSTDLILFDAKTPKGAALPGGMGLSFDWSLLSSYRSGIRWGLAGGLTPGNVKQAIAATRAPLVDTSSGVESAPGIKDVDRIAAFCKAARAL